ncbi:hypothetical protein GCM10011507_33480 [Edaphobacter acidisoli]|uniref:DUF6950 domain-containing protein n=1 Tax=Edaphobacter acidisoli TaxID=2040573 RepID=A0A916S0W8_9BACT|nr:hypothetical protein [Edaphobacter acidisoli]GGA79548.1 hypothetical protein GCM10011507_33480 [Edaphobacter acidisoli]
MPLKRVDNWDTVALDQFFVARRTMPFAWGKNDCCLFTADAIQAMTGVDLAADFRGKYSDAKSAFALIHSLSGGSTVADAAAWCATKYGLTEWVDKAAKPLPLMAKRGDLIVVENAGQLIAGIVHLNGRDVISVAEQGAVRLPLTAVQRAWKV